MAKATIKAKNLGKVSRLFYSKYVLILVGCVMFFAHLDALYPTIMEARNFVSAREILESHDWIYTKLNGLPRYEKPPLPTWLTAIMGYFFGTGNLTALRIPNALLTLIAGYYTYKIVLEFFKEKRIALYSTFIFFTAYLILYVGKSNVWDVYCYCFMWIAIYYFIKVNQPQSYLTLDSPSTWKRWIIFAILGGCSLLSKGPMGVIEVFVPFFIGYLIFYNPQFFKYLDYKKAIVSVALMLVIGLSWYYIIYTTDYDNFMRIFNKEMDARVTRNVKPWYRYLSFTGQMAIWVVPSFIGLLLWTVRKKVHFSKNYYIFLIWVLVSVFILSLFPEKKERYLFPVMFPLSIIAGICIYYWNVSQVGLLKISRNIYYFLGSVLAIGISIGTLIFINEISFYLIIFSFVMFYFGIAMAGSLIRKRFEISFKYMVYMAVWTMLMLVPMILPKFFDNPNYKTVRQVTNQFPKLKLYSVETYSPEIWFEYQQIIPDYKSSELESGIIKDDKFLLLKDAEYEVNVKDLKDYKLLNTIAFDENLEPEGAPNYSKRKYGEIYVMERK